MLRLGFSWGRYFRGMVAYNIEFDVLGNNFNSDMEINGVVRGE
jgi:hypothetical protein